MTNFFSLRNKKVWVAGDRGMVGRALLKRLEKEQAFIVSNRIDLRNQAEVFQWLEQEKPDVVIIAAARVGGIVANRDEPADFLYDNLMIETNIIHGAFRAGTEKLLFLGSSCIYPRDAAQPIRAEALLTGALEPTNEAYAIAKIAGIKLCQSYRRQHGCRFISAMPCNLYGPGDRYDAVRSHVIPALILKMEDARRRGAERLSLWGTGTPLREFLYVDDLADALVFLLSRYDGEAPVNIGSGEEISIAALAEKIAVLTGYHGEIVFDSSYPDGTARKLLDSGPLTAMGWQPQTLLDDGLREAYAWYCEHTRLDHAA